jgi:hypothetical protein
MPPGSGCAGSLLRNEAGLAPAGVEPAPLYLVELAAGDRVEVSQARMRRIR